MKRPDSITWFNAAIASTAVVLGCCLFIGHEMLASELQRNFGYSSTPFSIYSYDEVLMEGVDTIFRILAPRFIPMTLVALVIHRVFPTRVRLILVLALSTPLAIVMFLTPTTLGPHMLSFLNAHWQLVLAFVSLAIIGLTIEFSSGTLTIPSANWAMLVVVIFGWGFVLWFLPRMVPIDFHCFPKATIQFGDGRIQTYSLLGQRTDMLVMGDGTAGNVVLIAMSSIREVTIDECR